MQMALDDRHDLGPVPPGWRWGRGLRHGAAAGGPQGPGLRGHAVDEEVDPTRQGRVRCAAVRQQCRTWITSLTA